MYAVATLFSVTKTKAAREGVSRITVGFMTLKSSRSSGWNGDALR